MNTLCRDYFDGADRSTAAAVLDQIPSWISDYNGIAPHSALGYRAPAEYRKLLHDGQAANVGRGCLPPSAERDLVPRVRGGCDKLHLLQRALTAKINTGGTDTATRRVAA